MINNEEIIKMALNIITNEEIERIKKYVGKELEITVNINETFWDCGDPINNDYDVKYGIILENITTEDISGRLCEEQIYREGVRKKGELMVQPFRIHCSEDFAWFGPFTKQVVLIKHLDGILYKR